MQTGSAGSVRAVLLDHLRSSQPGLRGVPADDPGMLVPAAEFASQLDQVARTHGEAALRRLAHDYVALWARTFRTLVKHLRGRPERTLQLWCEEVYPFLRGDRRAARLERRGRNEAHVLLADDLPAPYLAGLLEAFVALSGADAHAKAIGRETFTVTYHLHPSDQAARAVHWIAGLRIPLLATAGLAALTAIAWTAAAGAFDPLRALIVLVGTVAAQSGANALHDLREKELGPLAAPRTGRAWRWFQAVGSYLVAGGALTFLTVTGHFGLLGFAAAGLLLGVGYALLADHGLGPLIAIIAHGPLILLGTAWAMEPSIVATDWPVLTVTGLAPGLLAATMLSLGDLADRPLDEAAGRRTLAVRLPQTRNVVLLALLALAGAATAAAVIGRITQPPLALWFLPSFGIALALAREVHLSLDDPHGLARARATAMGLHMVTTLLLAALILQGVSP